MQNERVNTLDLIRFVAAVAVVLYHYTARYTSNLTSDPELFKSAALFTKYGYLGVNLFFMISGFVILSSAINSNPINFLISRATRLYPTFWVSVSVTAIFVFFFEAPSPAIGWIQYLANLTMLNDYLHIENLDGVYWTLQAELKFYGCVFLLLLFGWINQYKKWLTVWLLATISFILFACSVQ